MSLSRSRLEVAMTSVLVVCAVIMTSLVLNRELTPTRPTVAALGVSHLEGWRDYLATDKTFGPPSGRIRIVEFVDFQCPYCTVFARSLDSLRKLYPGEVFVAIRHYPLSMHKSAAKAARAAECAVQKGVFERFYNFAFGLPDSMWSARLAMIATAVGIADTGSFALCVDSEWAMQRVLRDSVDGARAGLSGTPMVIMNGWLFPGTPSVADMVAVIEQEGLVR